MLEELLNAVMGEQASELSALSNSYRERGLGAPKQVEYLAGYLEAERPGRKASKRAAPLRRCAPPAPKTFGGHDTADRSWGGADF